MTLVEARAILAKRLTFANDRQIAAVRYIEDYEALKDTNDPRVKRCEACNGTGLLSMTCDDCEGTGRVYRP